MSLIASYYDDAMRVALAVTSTFLMIVSIKAYRKRSDGRYLLLMLAFIFYCIASISSMFLALFVDWGPTVIPIFELYLIPSLELLMVVSFLIALIWSSKSKKRILMVFLMVIILLVVLFASTVYVSEGNNTQSLLPAGCVRQNDGFLIIASSLGYNDSIAHGAPVKSWPVLAVTKDTDVRITICNIYAQAVGFQVTHYLADKIETVLPGQVISVNFFANQTGTFLIYCSTFNSIHIYLQGGELNVL